MLTLTIITVGVSACGGEGSDEHTTSPLTQGKDVQTDQVDPDTDAPDTDAPNTDVPDTDAPDAQNDESEASKAPTTEGDPHADHGDTLDSENPNVDGGETLMLIDEIYDSLQPKMDGDTFTVTIPEDHVQMLLDGFKANQDTVPPDEVVSNDDETSTLRFEKATHEKMVASMDANMQSFYEQVTETTPAIVDVEADTPYTDIVVKVDGDAYDEAAASVVESSIPSTAISYQIWEGKAKEDIEIHVTVVDQDSGDTLESYSEKGR